MVLSILYLQVEILRRKMEGLSKGVLLERMEEEYGPMLTSATSSAASSTSTSRRIELPDLSSFPIRHQDKVEFEVSISIIVC